MCEPEGTSSRVNNKKREDRSKMKRILWVLALCVGVSLLATGCIDDEGGGG